MSENALEGLKLIRDLGKISYGKQGQSQKEGLYLCHCGKEFESLINNVKRGNTKSCGCSRKTHGKAKTKEYQCWQNMKKRCYNSKDINYENYGARGIVVCDRWLNSFEDFYSDMKDCPEGYSLDRIDVDGNYEPDNCRWSTRSEQAYNTRIPKNNSTGIPGVCFHIRREKYQVRIAKEGKRIHLGYFLSLEDAIKARHEAEILYYDKLKI